jgi:ABC-type sugar transport system ATPase subunit
VLLLDEPFSALDAELRHRMRELVRRVQRGLSITMLFVTPTSRRPSTSPTPSG